MSCNLQLQRDTKVFMSTIDLEGGAAVSDMTPANTWKVEVLAGYAVSQASATQDIQPLESGSSPDRSSTRFNTAIEPVDWNFQVYVRPTGIETAGSGDGVSESSNVKPIADWYLWQALMSNANAAIGSVEHSAWQDTGRFDTTARAASANVSAHSPNFGSATEYHLYFAIDNVFYQVQFAAVNEATLDAAIDAISTTTWTGFGTDLTELEGVKRNNAVSVFGGILNNGTTVTANDNANAITAASSFHPWATWNSGGTLQTASFIKNRLSTVDINHQPEGGGNVNYTFPVTALSWTWNNNVTYLTPEELDALNSPIGNFTGARLISGSVTAYLRHDDGDSAQLFRNIINDSRVRHSESANANIQIGGTSVPFMALYMPATQFSIPTHNIEDIVSVTAEFQAQEPETSCGNGGEIELFAKR